MNNRQDVLRSIRFIRNSNAIRKTLHGVLKTHDEATGKLFIKDAMKANARRIRAAREVIRDACDPKKKYTPPPHLHQVLGLRASSMSLSDAIKIGKANMGRRGSYDRPFIRFLDTDRITPKTIRHDLKMPYITIGQNQSPVIYSRYAEKVGYVSIYRALILKKRDCYFVHRDGFQLTWTNTHHLAWGYITTADNTQKTTRFGTDTDKLVAMSKKAFARKLLREIS